MGSLELPLRPLSLALASEASFAARTLDVDVEHLEEVLCRAARHRGSAIVEIYQNCKIFNDGVFEYATHPGFKQDHVIYLQQGQPLVFGKDQARGIRLKGMSPEIVALPRDASSTQPDVLVHDEQAAELTRPFLLSRMTYPDYPECFGVFRAVERPTFTDLMLDQHEQAVRTHGPGTLEKLFAGDDFWEVK
jgi:2-oxoglutarate ferredoxin oxidoreductase subunit beta